MTSSSGEPWALAHQEAIQNQEHTYIDPRTGALVMTELAHSSRGFCCGNGCRHCPWTKSDDAKPAR